LGVLSSTGNLNVENLGADGAEGVLRAKASSQKTIQFVMKLRADNPALTTLEIGESVSKEFGYPTWATASLKRYGSGLNTWARWTSGEQVRHRSSGK
jgi:hypothetical protein